MSRRTERVGEQLRAEIARILLEEVADPRVRMVTLTRVDVSPDLARADVGWSALSAPREDEDEGEGERELSRIQDGLSSAAGFVRRRMAQSLDLRRVPRLHFRYDPSLEQGDRTLSLLRAIGHEPEEA